MSETQRIDGPHARVYRILRNVPGIRTAAQLEQEQRDAETVEARTVADRLASAREQLKRATTPTGRRVLSELVDLLRRQLEAGDRHEDEVTNSGGAARTGQAVAARRPPATF